MNAGSWQRDLDGSVCQLTNEARAEMSFSIYALQEEEDEVKVSLNKKIQAVRLTDGVFG